MERLYKGVGAAVVGVFLGATASMAQGTLTGTTALDDRIDDLNQNARDDLKRSNDDYRFGNPEYRPGLSGSASLGYTGQTGNNESQTFSAGARLRFAQGQLIQTIGVALEFEDENGSRTKEEVFGVYDANYYINDKFYGFVLGRVQSDALADTAGENRTDAFIGVGPGYRIINTPDITWRVQAGIGLSYTKDGAGTEETETGYIVSSRFFYAFNENVFATNDTDFLKSDSAFRVNNDLGVNFKMSDAFSTRVSYLTDYDDSRAIKTDNKLGISLVYGF